MNTLDSSPVILVVDDEPTARLTVEALLGAENYQLHFAVNGQELLDRIGIVNPDVILLDVMMPGMTGFEACQRLKAKVAFRHIPVILLTALTDVSSLVKGLEAGADEFLTKPVNGSELRARIRSMLRIKQQYDELQAMIKIREDLTHMTVHDLRTPLTTLTLYADLAKRNINRPDRLIQHLDTIQTQALRLQNLVNEILMMAKIEKGELVLKKQPFSLKEFLRRVEEDHRSAATLKQIDFQVKIPFLLPKVELDENLFRRTVDNLLSNAFKFTPSGSKVVMEASMSLSRSNTGFRLVIADEGTGIPELHRERIFDKFAVVELQDSNISQVGLGLAFCKLVVEAHGGVIYVEDNKPQGARFVIEL